MMNFEYQFSDKDPKIMVSLNPGADLDEVLQTFEQFLRGAGYYFDGRIEIVEEETEGGTKKAKTV